MSKYIGPKQVSDASSIERGGGERILRKRNVKEVKEREERRAG